jgi:hypothetical protein
MRVSIQRLSKHWPSWQDTLMCEGTQVKTLLHRFDSMIKNQGAEVRGSYLFRKPRIESIIRDLFSSKFVVEANFVNRYV